MREEVREYCVKKYVKMPDVSEIKNGTQGREAG
jgi:hypothetical protein